MSAEASAGHSSVNRAKQPKDRFTSPVLAAMRFVAQRGLLKPVVWSWTRVRVLGRERLTGIHGSFIAVANHSSHLDTPLIVGSLPRPMARYLAAGAAADYFFDVWWRRGLTALFFNAFPVRRTATNTEPVSSKGLLTRGVPLMIFPEGTRSKDGQVAEFKPGAAGLAISCGVPIVPIALIGAHIAHPRGTNWPKWGRLPVGVVYGDPILPKPGESSEQLTSRAKSEILRLRDLHSAEILGSTNPS